MPANTAHVVIDTLDGGAFKCRHCGARLVIEYPALIDYVCAIARAFLSSHRRCKPNAQQD